VSQNEREQILSEIVLFAAAILMLLDRPPGDVPPKRWQQFGDDCTTFGDGEWAKKTAPLAWGPLDPALRNAPA
jgi:hypothetical protein